ncbi:MAG: DNA repair protein RecO [Myxococcales bacterium]|nr:DNA repair protein RecO [Myxococcales bacterium]
MPRPTKAAVERVVDTPALLVRRVDVGDQDVLATFFTRERGAVSVSVRRARAPKSRLGPIEPLHTLQLRLEILARADAVKLRDLAIVRARLALVEDPARLDAASRLLRWLRALAPANVPEPVAFDLVDAALDRIEDGPSAAATAVLAVAGLSLAAAFGYRLELDSCVRCSAPCPEGSSALLDPAAGGIVCRACGGGSVLMRAALRQSLRRAMRGEETELGRQDAERVADLAERTIAAHAKGQEARR